MKRALLTGLLIFLLTPAFALFCKDCGRSIPDDARFCPACGKSQTSSSTPMPLVPPAYEEAPMPPSTPMPDSSSYSGVSGSFPPGEIETGGLSEGFMRGYEPIEQLELLLTGKTFNSISRKALEHRSRMALNVPKQEKYALRQTAVERKMHELQLRKLTVLERYLDAWQQADSGQRIGEAVVRRDKELFHLAHLNEMITTLAVGAGDHPAALERVAELDAKLDKATREYVVTAPFLEIGGQRLRRNDRIWVVEVDGGQVRVVHTGPNVSNPPLHGWVAVASLDKRSTWRYEPALLTAFSSANVFVPAVPATTVVFEAAPRPPTTVIVIGKTWCRQCGYFSCRCRYLRRLPFPRRITRPAPPPPRRGHGRPPSGRRR